MRAGLIKRVLRLFAALPLRGAQALGAGIGGLLAVTPNALRRVTEINLRLCLPELDDPERARLARASAIETGKTAAETGALWSWDRDRVLALMRQVSGREAVDAAVRRGNGVIFISPHLGAWEMAGLHLSAHYPMTTLYRPPRLQALEELSRSARARLGARLVPTDAGGIRALYQALSRGEALGILPDQNPAPGSGVFAPFFGVPAYTMVLIARLARKTGAAVFAAWAERLPQGKGYHLHLHPAPADIADSDPVVAATALNRLIEECVRVRPEQYQWSYKRFRVRPEGMGKVY